MNSYEIVYLVAHQIAPSYIKIGFTARKDLSKRMNELNTASPTGLTIIREYQVPKGYGRRVEQALHKIYQPYQSNGEWFLLNDTLLTAIDKWMENKLKKTD